MYLFDTVLALALGDMSIVQLDFCAGNPELVRFTDFEGEDLGGLEGGLEDGGNPTSSASLDNGIPGDRHMPQCSNSKTQHLLCNVIKPAISFRTYSDNQPSCMHWSNQIQNCESGDRIALLAHFFPHSHHSFTK